MSFTRALSIACISTFVLLSLVACGGGQQNIAPLPAAGSVARPLRSVGHRASPHVTITEYSLSGVAPNAAGNGAMTPDGSLWLGAGSALLHVTAAGSATAAPVPTGVCGFATCTATGSAAYRGDDTVWFTTQIAAYGQLGTGVVFMNGSGIIENGGALVISGYATKPVGNIAVGGDGRLWFAYCGAGAVGCNLVAAGSGPGSGPQAYPLGSYVPNSIAAGPDGKLYLTEVSTSGESSVARIATNGAILQRFALPVGSISSSGTASGIASGDDGRLWIVESGINKIARMTTDGALTQYSIPTPHAGARNIALASDRRLWFTEFKADKIGSIGRNGKITEFALPTPNAGPDGIASLSLAQCGGSLPRYLWIIEDTSDAVAKLSF
ncbi:MAG TPA: hypothetical protein VGG89_01570 [Candidatus Baltobacteraceae bacterium]|jgi:streptogramin lyase